MAFNVMIREKNTDYSNMIANDVFIYTESNSIGTGNPVIIPNTVGKILARLVITTGSGSIETSNDSYSDIKTGTATWKIWKSGIVSSTTEDWCQRVNAVRVVRATGTIVMKLLAY